MKAIQILVVTNSAPLQQGLGALLESLPEAPAVETITDLQHAYSWMGEHQPWIILLDKAILGENAVVALEKLRTLSQQTQRAVLVDNVEEIALLSHHAEAVLIKGVPPSTIAIHIANLLSAGKQQSRFPTAQTDI